jgi:ABC-type lipoprotein release transport system permease subunit
MRWLGQAFSRRRRYDELSESIREHLDEKIADLMDRGMTSEEAEQVARREFTLVMLCVSGGIALLLGTAGIYGVIAYSVSQRTREIGIRMALGAQRGAVVAAFVRQGMWLTVMGIAIGLVVASATMCRPHLRLQRSPPANKEAT